MRSFGAIYLHHRRVPEPLRPWRGMTVGLWLSTVVMAAAALYAIFLSITGGR